MTLDEAEAEARAQENFETLPLDDFRLALNHTAGLVGLGNGPCAQLKSGNAVIANDHLQWLISQCITYINQAEDLREALRAQGLERIKKYVEERLVYLSAKEASTKDKPTAQLYRNLITELRNLPLVEKEED